jgi:molybdopterin-guanine dinucleotide biosynthesis protein A
MGRPKHLIEQDGKTWLEMTVAKLEKKVEQVVISGGGEIPENLAGLPVIQDIPGPHGPLAGILSVMRWKKDVSWLVTACDQPAIREEALDWLLGVRNADVVAILPDLLGNGYVEPLLAYYDCRCRFFFEEIVVNGSSRIADLAGRPGVTTPSPPAHLHECWRNVNTPLELG